MLAHRARRSSGLLDRKANELGRNFGCCTKGSVVQDSQVLVNRSARGLRWQALLSFDPILAVGICLNQARNGGPKILVVPVGTTSLM